MLPNLRMLGPGNGNAPIDSMGEYFGSSQANSFAVASQSSIYNNNASLSSNQSATRYTPSRGLNHNSYNANNIYNNDFGSIMSDISSANRMAHSYQQHHHQQQQQQQQQQQHWPQSAPSRANHQLGMNNHILKNTAAQSAWNSHQNHHLVSSVRNNGNNINGNRQANGSNYNGFNAPTSQSCTPWAAAVKSGPDHQVANNQNYNSITMPTIGSWNPPDDRSGSNNRSGGWNSDGSSSSNRNNGVIDNGTAIWGDPEQKRKGTDWIESEALKQSQQRAKERNIGNIESFSRSNQNDISNHSNIDPKRSAQAAFESNVMCEKPLSSKNDNILESNQAIFTKAQGFTNVNVNQYQRQSSQGLPSAQSSLSSSSSTSSSSSASAAPNWSAFNSGDLVPTQGWPSSARISSNVSQERRQQYGHLDPMQYNSSVDKNQLGLSFTGKLDDANFSSLAFGCNTINDGPKRSSSNQQLKLDNFINRESALFCDWRNINDNEKEAGYDHLSSSILDDLSLASNSWMFTPDSSSSLNQLGSEKNSLFINGNSNFTDKMVNGNMDKSANGSNSNSNLSGPVSYRSNNDAIQNQLLTASALNDWSDFSQSTLQIESENMCNGRQSTILINGSGDVNGRPGPPPGLRGEFGAVMGTEAYPNRMSLLDSPRLDFSGGDASQQSKELPSKYWTNGWQF